MRGQSLRIEFPWELGWRVSTVWKEYSWVANGVCFNTSMVSGAPLRVNPANE